MCSYIVYMYVHRMGSTDSLLEMIKDFNGQSLTFLLNSLGLTILYPLLTIRVIFHLSTLYSIVSSNDWTFRKHSEPGEIKKLTNIINYNGIARHNNLIFCAGEFLLFTLQRIKEALVNGVFIECTINMK